MVTLGANEEPFNTSPAFLEMVSIPRNLPYVDKVKGVAVIGVVAHKRQDRINQTRCLRIHKDC